MLIYDQLLLGADELRHIVLLAMLFVGPCLGSFASAIAHRVPISQSWIFASANETALGGARSVCPACGGRLRWFDLLPIISWAFLRGRCRMCKAQISAVYPALEIGTMLAALALVLNLGLSWHLLCALVALPFLMALLVMTLRARVHIGKQLPIILAVIGLGWLGAELISGAQPSALFIVFDRVGGLVAYPAVGLFLPWLRKKIFGLFTEPLGELRLLAVAGLWLGLKLLPIFLIVAGLYGIVTAILRVVFKWQRQQNMAHAFVASFLIMLLAGRYILEFFVI